MLIQPIISDQVYNLYDENCNYDKEHCLKLLHDEIRHITSNNETDLSTNIELTYIFNRPYFSKLLNLGYGLDWYGSKENGQYVIHLRYSKKYRISKDFDISKIDKVTFSNSILSFIDDFHIVILKYKLESFI